MDTHDLVVKGDEGRIEADPLQAARPARPHRADAAPDARPLLALVLARQPQGTRHAGDARRHASSGSRSSRLRAIRHERWRRFPATQGRSGTAEAERLLWRAGFGPRRGQAASLARLGLDGAVRSLTHPPGERWIGPPPRDDKGRPLAPADAWGHDHLWWLDRMVRTQPAARRADDARLARLVRHLERGRRLAEADARAEPAAAPPRARQLRPPARLDHRQPRDADLALGHRQPQGRAERELRPRADGAVHARRGQRLHRARRPRAGPRAHRLDEHLEARQGTDGLPLRPEAPRHRA